MSAKHWKSWSRKRWKACTNSPCRWLWKSASDQTGGTWTESHLKIEPAIPRQVRQIANQPFPASQNFPGNTSRPDLSTRTGTPYGTSFEAFRSSEEDHMLCWPSYRRDRLAGGRVGGPFYDTIVFRPSPRQHQSGCDLAGQWRHQWQRHDWNYLHRRALHRTTCHFFEPGSYHQRPNYRDDHRDFSSYRDRHGHRNCHPHDATTADSDRADQAGNFRWQYQ